MADTERNTSPDRDLGASVRTVLQLLIVAGVIWVGQSIDTLKVSSAATQQKIVNMQQKIDDLRNLLSDVPALKDRAKALELGQNELLHWKQQIDEVNYAPSRRPKAP